MESSICRVPLTCTVSETLFRDLAEDVDFILLFPLEFMIRKTNEMFANIPGLDMKSLCLNDDVLDDVSAFLSAEEAVLVVANSVVHNLQVSTDGSQVYLFFHVEQLAIRGFARRLLSRGPEVSPFQREKCAVRGGRTI